MAEDIGNSMTRRRLLSMIGADRGKRGDVSGDDQPGACRATPATTDPIQLSGAPQGASVLVLGAGIAGMVAAYELRKAGYQVQVLEYNSRAGGRNWTLRGGDRYTELGGFTQECRFDPGLYINPGPVAPALSSPRHVELLQAARRAARALRPVQLQRLSSPAPTPSAASRSASAPSRRTITVTSPSCSPRPCKASELDAAVTRRGPGAAAGLAARMGRARQATMRYAPGPTTQRPARLRARIPAAASAGARFSRSRWG